MDLTAKIQSNSIRGDEANKIVGDVMREILNDIKPSFGPGAVDSYIIKNGAPYYTRDGKEVIESLTFDNELANYVHRILYQAVCNQGQNVGDGSTTLAVLYCHLYDACNSFNLNMSMDKLRCRWKAVVTDIINRLKASSEPLTEELLPSMLYTCTKDPDLTVKIREQLGEPLMNGAYIIPRKSNIASDFEVTVHTRPLLEVTRQWSIFPIRDTEDRAVIFYCNGVIDIADEDVIRYLMGTVMQSDSDILPMTVILLGHGINESTRRVLKELSPKLIGSKSTENNNVAIYTLDRYREMNTDELEDLSVIFSGQNGVSTMTRSLTYSAYLMALMRSLGETPQSGIFDEDPATIEAMKDIFGNPYRVVFDPVKGMAVERPLNPAARENYENLRRQIETEKSPIRKLDLTRRLQRSFGMFIDLEVGSTLLKDSQRKFELILDAILSSSEAARDGVIIGSSLLHLYRVLNSMNNRSPESIDNIIVGILGFAVENTIKDLADNLGASADDIIDKARNNDIPVEWFNAECDNVDDIWKTDQAPSRLITGDINPIVVEPFGVIKAILESSFLPVELFKAKVFHISGTSGFMGNYIN